MVLKRQPSPECLWRYTSKYFLDAYLLFINFAITIVCIADSRTKYPIQRGTPRKSGLIDPQAQKSMAAINMRANI